MTKKEIIGKYPVVSDRKGNELYLSTKDAELAMEEYAKEVLNWVLNQSCFDIKSDEPITMNDGDFYWMNDKNGDYPLDAEKIIKLYENDNTQTSGYISHSGMEVCKVQEQKLYIFTKADLSMLLTDNWCKAIDHLQDIVNKNDFSKNRKEYINNLLK